MAARQVDSDWAMVWVTPSKYHWPQILIIMQSISGNLNDMGFRPVSRKNRFVVLKSDNGVAVQYNDGSYEGFIRNKSIKNEGKLRSLIELLLIVGLSTTYFTTDITIVSGASMEPTYHSGEIIIKSKSSSDVKKILVSRNSVVKFQSPGGDICIKRVVGMHGDTIEHKGPSLYINGKFFGEDNIWYRKYLSGLVGDKSSLHKNKLSEPHLIKLKADQYYVMGDNKDNSVDSREYGPISSGCVLSVVSKN